MRVVLVVQKYNIILIDTIHELEKGKNCVFVVGNVIFPDHLNCCMRKGVHSSRLHLQGGGRMDADSGRLIATACRGE